MTHLSKPVRRVTDAVMWSAGRNRRIVTALVPPGTLMFRLAGCKTWYPFPVATCFRLAIQADAAARRAAKKTQRAERARAKRGV